MTDDASIDYAALFAATPTPYLVLAPDLRIRDVNRAYLHATARRREDLIGRDLFDAFPGNPDDPDATGVRNLRASLERARETGEPDVMGVQRYDVTDPGGRFAERYWSPINVPVLDDRGRTVLLLHRVEDVTEYVRRQRTGEEHREREARWRRRTDSAEADLYARARELEELTRRLREAGEQERRVSLTLQEAMLPACQRAIRGLTVATRYRPAADALQIGGDWYDVVELEAGRVTLAVGDVVGKGLPAAAVMGQLRSALTAAGYGVTEPSKALEALDRFTRTVTGAIGSTALHVMLDLGGESLRYSTAGHIPGLLAFDGGPSVYLTGASGPPLGVAPERPRPVADAAFPPGATLVLCTDGLLERREQSIDVGLRAVAAAVGRHLGRDVDTLADALIAELLGDGGTDDDVALVVARNDARPA